MIPFIGPVAGGAYRAGRQGRTLGFNTPNDPAYIVLHTMDGTVASTDTRFKTPGSGRSAHYGVALNGSVVQWVKDTDTAIHSDVAEIDLTSIAVTHEDGGETQPPRTDALYAASSALVRDLCLRYGIPLSRRWVIKHSEVPGVVDSSCPSGLDADRIVAMALDGYEVQPPSQVMSDQSTPDGVTGAAPAAPPAPASPGSTTTLQDIANGIYQDPARWTDIHSAIQGVVDELPAIKLLIKMLGDSVAASGAGSPSAGIPAANPAANVPSSVSSTTTPNATGGSVNRKQWGGSQGAVFAVQIFYLTLLAALGIIYFVDRSLINLPDNLGPIPTPIPWFGALGAVLISMVALTQHRNDWDPSFRFWHWARPLLGASFGTISVLIFQAGILAAGTQPSASGTTIPKDLLYYLIAFVVGYREETFRELIKRLTDIVFSPGSQGATITVTAMAPTSGPAAGGTPVTVLGGGLDNTDSVRFGDSQAQFRIQGDGQLSVTSPPAQAGSTVNVSVSAGTASAIAGAFTYT